jgi:CubicO group peptidase (beta-lactamase class C family)
MLADGKISCAAAGVTNVTTGVPLTTDTVMHIGSITKVLNATLVMQLVDEGRVDLDQPVVQYLPELELADREARDLITVRMLLNHTSGIDGSWLPDYGHDEETIDRAIQRCVHLGQLFRPGTDWSYCNVAPVIAGYLVQKLRQRSWYQVMRERIFEPLALQHAATSPEEALLYRASVGHYLDPATGRLTRTPFAFGPLSFAPAGSTLMLSAHDVVRFAQTHIALGATADGGRILSASSAAHMRQVSVNNKGKGYTFDLDMGLGWMLPAPGLLHHTGGGPGVLSVLYAHPRSGRAAAVLTNSAHGWRLANELLTEWLRSVGSFKPFGVVDIQVPSQAIHIDADRYVGTYEDVLTRYRVGSDAGGLTLLRQKKFVDCENLSTDESLPARLMPLGNERFLLESRGTEEELPAARVFTFRSPDSTGRMHYLGCGSLHRRAL